MKPIPGRPRWRPALLLLALILILPQCSTKSRDEYVREGLAHIEKENYQAAEHAFRRAIEADPKHADGYYHLGSIYNVRKQYPEAEAQFKKAVRLDPTHYDAHFSLAYALEQQGRQEQADKEYAAYRRLKKMSDRLRKKRQETR